MNTLRPIQYSMLKTAAKMLYSATYGLKPNFLFWNSFLKPHMHYIKEVLVHLDTVNALSVPLNLFAFTQYKCCDHFVSFPLFIVFLNCRCKVLFAEHFIFLRPPFFHKHLEINKACCGVSSSSQQRHSSLFVVVNIATLSSLHFYLLYYKHSEKKMRWN